MNKIESVNELKNKSYIDPVTLHMFVVEPSFEVTCSARWRCSLSWYWE